MSRVQVGEAGLAGAPDPFSNEPEPPGARDLPAYGSLASTQV